MKLLDIRPKLYKLYYFKYICKNGAGGKLSLEKSQYAYRLLLVDKGCLDVCVDGRTERMQVGDILFLVPGSKYRLLPCGADFSLYNLFFGFSDAPSDEKVRPMRCIFMDEYDPGMRLPRINFEDSPCFNESRVFKNAACNKTFEGLFSTDYTDEASAFFVQAKLLSVFADMLTAHSGTGAKKSAAEEILSYVRRNPHKDLSGETLSKIFCYHKNHINKLIKRETGKSLSEYIRYVKIEHAIALLFEEGRSPTEIAASLGYYDYSHFYKAFVAETGVSPTEYAKGRKNGA